MRDRGTVFPVTASAVGFQQLAFFVDAAPGVQVPTPQLTMAHGSMPGRLPVLLEIGGVGRHTRG